MTFLTKTYLTLWANINRKDIIIKLKVKTSELKPSKKSQKRQQKKSCGCFLNLKSTLHWNIIGVHQR